MVGARGNIALLLGLGGLVTAGFLLVPVFPQPLWYHEFADQRCFFRIPHALNVVSNLPFLVVGFWGVLFLSSPPLCGGSATESRATLSERMPYLVFFLGIALTGLGSAYYHSDPTNDRLLWDRLPLAVAFMALFAAVLAERVQPRLGPWLLGPLVVLGAASVVYWHWTEMQGHGDLRPYLVVQFLPMLALPVLLLLFPARYSRTQDMVGALSCYVVAKVFELLDGQVYASGGIVSGHTLKHLVAGISPFLILLMLKRRRPYRIRL